MLGPRLSILGRPVIYTDDEGEYLGLIVSAEDNNADIFLPLRGVVVANVSNDPEVSPNTWRFVPNEDR